MWMSSVFVLRVFVLFLFSFSSLVFDNPHSLKVRLAWRVAFTGLREEKRHFVKSQWDMFLVCKKIRRGFCTFGT